MRVMVGKPIRVGPGDTIAVRGQLPETAKLGRLYVFAKEGQGQFAPYVQNIGVVTPSNEPFMYTPMSFRLDSARREYTTSFVADFDGFIAIQQEVDTAKDPRVKVRMKRTICRDLGWKEWLTRWLHGMLTWPTLKLSR